MHAGKVRYIGHSTFPASQIVEAQWVARDRGLQRFVTEQPPYSMLVRAVEADVLPTCLRHGMGVMSYSPLTGGWLSGRWRKETGQQSSSRAARLPERFDLANPYNQRKLDAVEELAQLADETGLTLIQLAIAFVLSHPAITAALIGPRTMEQLESQLAAADVVLDDAVLDRIDEIVPPGITINPADNSFANPALEPAARRRRVMSTGFPESDAAAAFGRQRRRQTLTKLASRMRRRDDVTFMLPFEDVVAALGRTGERHLGLQSITLDSVVGAGLRPPAGRVRPPVPARLGAAPTTVGEHRRGTPTRTPDAADRRLPRGRAAFRHRRPPSRLGRTSAR